jgi:polar amino acid transport system substrate-binding protein
MTILPEVLRSREVTVRKWFILLVASSTLFISASFYLATQAVTQIRSAGSILDVVGSEGRVIVGIGQEAAPYGYRDKGELVGFDVDIARAVAKRLETYVGRAVALQFTAVTDETRIAWVQSGQVHMSLSHTNITRKRLANIDFTVPYGWDGKGILYRTAAGQLDLTHFAGKTIGIKRASSSEGEIKTYFAAKGWTLPVLKQFDNHAAGIRALVEQQIDGFTDDSSIIISTAILAGHKFGPAGQLDITNTQYSPAIFGIGVRQDDSRWRNALNFALHDLWLNREFHAIHDRWFGANSICPMPLGDRRMEPFVPG